MSLHTDEPECSLRREAIEEGRTVLACDAESSSPVIDFLWYKHNKSISEVISNSADTMPGVGGPSSGGQSAASQTMGLGSRQSAVLVLSDNEIHAYSCIVANSVGVSKPCKLAEQQRMTGKSLASYPKLFIFNYWLIAFVIEAFKLSL